MGKLLIYAVLLTAAVGCGLNTVSNKQAPHVDAGDIALSDDELITVEVFDHLIRDVLTHSPRELCFVAGNEIERRALSLKFPGVTLFPGSDAERVPERVRAKTSKQSGILFAVLEKRLAGKQAFVHAGYIGQSAISFDFELRKNDAWKIEEIGDPVVADFSN